MLKYKADIKTLLYIITGTILFAGQWYFGFNWAVYIVYLYFSIAVSAITHNHNHINMWTKKWLNIITDWCLTVFYGMPIFVWIPTHNRNHHRYNNKEPDITRTYRYSDHNDSVSLIQYLSVNGHNQIKEGIIPYMKELKLRNPRQFYENVAQMVVLVLWLVVFFVWNWKKAMLYVLIPQQVSQNVVMIFNYVQHVHADEESEYNHSRNFTGVNPFLFNNGFHTVHHLRANLHWSETPEAHKKIAHLIRPDLQRGSLWVYLIETYVLSYFIPRYRSNSMRLQRIAKQQAEPAVRIRELEREKV